MLAEQRHQLILERVRLHGRVKATDLAEDLGVSDITVRRDLNDLHDAGLLERTLVIMCGEFGRTPRISTLPQYYKLP